MDDGGNAQVLVAGGVFLVAYALIVIERIDRTLVALAGGLMMVILGVLDQDEAFAAIDFNVIFLLAGMMILAQTLARTGLFEAIALWAVRRGGHRPFGLLLVIALVTAGLSAFLDNVTTVVLLAPVAISVARTLGVSPVPFLIAQIFASNIGGTATLIGDPPNIMIGSAAGLGFVDFLLEPRPVVLVILVAFSGIMWAVFGRSLREPGEGFFATPPVDPGDSIHDRPLLVRSLVVLAFTLAGFLVHDLVDLEVATVALAGATALMLSAGSSRARPCARSSGRPCSSSSGCSCWSRGSSRSASWAASPSRSATSPTVGRRSPRWRSCGCRPAPRRSSTTSRTRRPRSRSSRAWPRAGCRPSRCGGRWPSGRAWAET